MRTAGIVEFVPLPDEGFTLEHKKNLPGRTFLEILVDGQSVKINCIIIFEIKAAGNGNVAVFNEEKADVGRVKAVEELG